MKKLLLLVLFCFALVALKAQKYIHADFPLNNINGVNLRNAWAGGMNLPQFSPVDLNNDGIDDLVVYDRDAKLATPYINQGTPNQVDYHFAPEFVEQIPQGVSNYMLFRDYNCDGIKDIYRHYQKPGWGASIAVLEGSYTVDNKIQFTMKKEILFYDYGGSFPGTIFIYNTDIPAIDDIDGDGDLDILAFNLSFSFPKNIHFYRNTSAENGFGCDSLNFILENSCFGQLEETGVQSICNLSSSIDSCYNNPYWLPNVRPALQQAAHDLSRNGRHVGASLSTIDYNGDSIKDIYLGGVSYRNINQLTSTLVNDTILIVSQDTFFPSYDKSVDIFTFASSYFLDVNNDGLTDMLAAPTESAICEAVMDSVAWYYQNTTSNTNMQFSFQQKDFLVGEMLDLGEHAYPVIYDFNADGLLDILVGGMGRCRGDGTSVMNPQGTYDRGLSLLLNTGTANNPSFSVSTKNYAMLDTINKNRLHPTLGDLDGDGDKDLLLGSADGTLTFFENTAGTAAPATWDSPIYNWNNIDVGDDSAPTLADLDRDGDLDLIIGNYAGLLKYFENAGTPSSPAYSPTPMTDTLSGFSATTYYGRNTMPYFYDNAGSWEMFLGQQNGEIVHLDSVDNNVLGDYDTVSLAFGDIYVGQHADVAIADLNNDGFLDYVVGNVRGGLSIHTDEDYILAKKELPSTAQEQNITLFPNPANKRINVHLHIPPQENIQVRLLNALGQQVLVTSPTLGRHTFSIDVAKLQAGVYFVDVRADDWQEVGTFVKE